MVERWARKSGNLSSNPGYGGVIVSMNPSH